MGLAVDSTDNPRGVVVGANTPAKVGVDFSLLAGGNCFFEGVSFDYGVRADSDVGGQSIFFGHEKKGSRCKIGSPKIYHKARIVNGGAIPARPLSC